MFGAFQGFYYVFAINWILNGDFLFDGNDGDNDDDDDHENINCNAKEDHNADHHNKDNLDKDNHHTTNHNKNHHDKDNIGRALIVRQVSAINESLYWTAHETW